jgi:thiamine pyrophosphate-dependent acetolactate synthase large subunit-like protein
VDVNKSHDDNNGGGQREKKKACLTSLKVTLHMPSSIMSRKIETCVPEKKVMNCSVAKESVKRVCYSLKRHDKPLLEVSGGGENEEEEEETFVRKVEIGVGKESENSREIVKRKGFDVLWREI